MSHSMSLFNKLHLHLFEGKSIAESYLTEDELKVKERIEAGFHIMLEDPTKSEKEIRNFLCLQFDVHERTAFRDLTLIKAIFGNFKKTNKEYYRYRVIALLERAAELAKEKGDYFGIVSAAKELGRFTRLDQHDPEELPFDEVAVPEFIPVNDIEILGFKRDPNIAKTRKLLEKKYFGKIEDAEIIE